MMIIVFVVCVTPDAIMSTLFGYGYYEEDNYLVRGVREITDLLLTVNSAVNFVLYCTFNAVFRKRFVTMFCPASYLQKYNAPNAGEAINRSTLLPFHGALASGGNVAGGHIVAAFNISLNGTAEGDKSNYNTNNMCSESEVEDDCLDEAAVKQVLEQEFAMI